MRVAVVGGTHGNEPVGIEVIQHLERRPPEDAMHSFETFWANPKAFELGRRFVDSDLNRTFGKNGRGEGYEIERSKELTDKILDALISSWTYTQQLPIWASQLFLLKRMIQLDRRRQILKQTSRARLD